MCDDAEDHELLRGSNGKHLTLRSYQFALRREDTAISKEPGASDTSEHDFILRPIHVNGQYAAKSRPLTQPAGVLPTTDIMTRTTYRSIGEQAARGAIWIFLGFSLGKILNLGLNVVLARLLTPTDFGLVSFAMILIGAFSVLQDLGIPDALIYSNEDMLSVGGTALTMNVGATCVLFVASVIAAPFMARINGNHEVAAVIVVLSIGLVMLAAGSVQAALMSRQLAFRRKFAIDILALVVEAVIAIALASLGFGLWSLVLGYVSNALAETILLWYLSPIRPSPRFDITVARDLFAYGKHVSINAIVTFFVNNVDFFVVGAFLGSAKLGVYTMAFNIAILPATAISQVIRTAMFPAYSRIRDNIDRLTNMFDDVFVVVWALSIAVGLGVFICGPPYMKLLLGQKWAAIERPLQILAIYGTLRSINWVFPPAYKAIGKPNLEWMVNLSRLIVLVPLMLIGCRFGINGVSVVQVIILGMYVPVNAAIFARVIGKPFTSLGRLIVPHLCGASCVAAALLLVRLVPFLRRINLDLYGPAIVLLASIMMYACIMFVLDRRLFLLLKSGAAHLV